MSSLSTGASNTNAPASSMVLKKIGATLLPKQTPPARLLGTPGISSPKNHNTELVADLREEPVPTTSPTNATGKPLALMASICLIGPFTPGSSGNRPRSEEHTSELQSRPHLVC